MDLLQKHIQPCALAPTPSKAQTFHTKTATTNPRSAQAASMLSMTKIEETRLALGSRPKLPQSHCILLSSVTFRIHTYLYTCAANSVLQEIYLLTSKLQNKPNIPQKKNDESLNR